MCDAGTMRPIQRARNLDRDRQRLGERKSGAVRPEPFFERLALEQLHDEIRRPGLFANVVQRADVRMGELRDRAGLTIEAFAELRIGRERLRKDFDRDRAIEPRVAGFVHLAHAAGPKGGHNLVRAEAGAGGEGQLLP